MFVLDLGCLVKRLAVRITLSTFPEVLIRSWVNSGFRGLDETERAQLVAKAFDQRHIRLCLGRGLGKNVYTLGFYLYPKLSLLAAAGGENPRRENSCEVDAQNSHLDTSPGVPSNDPSPEGT